MNSFNKLYEATGGYSKYHPEEGCAEGHPNVTSLRSAVEQHWADMSDASMVNSVKRSWSRLERCIAAEGGTFEKQSIVLYASTCINIVDL